MASTVSSNRRISTPALKKTIEMQTGRKASSRTVNRARGVMLNSSEQQKKDAYSVLPAYLKELQDNSPGTVATAENCCPKHLSCLDFIREGWKSLLATHTYVRCVWCVVVMFPLRCCVCTEKLLLHVSSCLNSFGDGFAKTNKSASICR